MAAPQGNTNAAKAKIWSDAIRKAVMRPIANDPEKRKKIDKLAETIVEAGLTGDIAALKEIGDRLEGKAAQTIQGNIGITDLSEEEIDRRIEQLEQRRKA